MAIAIFDMGLATTLAAAEVDAINKNENKNKEYSLIK
jgi:hypothetical protein